MSAGRPYIAVALDDIETLPAVGGTLNWRPVRRHLGIRAFGINAYIAYGAGDDVVEDHDETGHGAGGHEELYIVVAGHARFTIGGEEVDAPLGTLVFLGDPGVRRKAVAVAPETTVLAIGGPVGEAYTVSAWEPVFAAMPLSAAGEHSAAVAMANEALADHPDNPSVLYNLACFESLGGWHEEAVAHLARAFELEPKTKAWAETDTDLDPIRDRPDYPG
ncbi:MAG TPA: hypothetical protein VKD47_03225 [Miltoncostaeaceae bacterium]|nr:hypothetical protein [Miltoncostaeaceae bacterium]